MLAKQVGFEARAPSTWPTTSWVTEEIVTPEEGSTSPDCEAWSARADAFVGIIGEMLIAPFDGGRLRPLLGAVAMIQTCDPKTCSADNL